MFLKTGGAIALDRISNLERCRILNNNKEYMFVQHKNVLFYSLLFVTSLTDEGLGLE